MPDVAFLFEERLSRGVGSPLGHSSQCTGIALRVVDISLTSLACLHQHNSHSGHSYQDSDGPTLFKTTRNSLNKAHWVEHGVVCPGIFHYATKAEVKKKRHTLR